MVSVFVSIVTFGYLMKKENLAGRLAAPGVERK